MGFIGIIKERKKFTNEPLILLGPQQMLIWLEYYDERFEPISHYYNFITNNEFWEKGFITSTITTKTLYENLDIQNISTTYVKHCPYAYGVKITLKDGRKIVYR